MEDLKEYTIITDVTIDGVEYTAGQTQKFTDEVSQPFVDSGEIALVGTDPVVEPADEAVETEEVA